MFQKLNSLCPNFCLHDSWPFCHALFSRKFLFIFSITCLTFYSWSFHVVSELFFQSFQFHHLSSSGFRSSGGVLA